MPEHGEPTDAATDPAEVTDHPRPVMGGHGREAEVGRLAGRLRGKEMDDDEFGPVPDPDCVEAADLLEAVAGELERLRGVVAEAVGPMLAAELVIHDGLVGLAGLGPVEARP